MVLQPHERGIELGALDRLQSCRHEGLRDASPVPRCNRKHIKDQHRKGSALQGSHDHRRVLHGRSLQRTSRETTARSTKTTTSGLVTAPQLLLVRVRAATASGVPVPAMTDTHQRRVRPARSASAS